MSWRQVRVGGNVAHESALVASRATVGPYWLPMPPRGGPVGAVGGPEQRAA